jgi:D-sedoheptulose 7-phosphate isomerase
MKLIYEGITMIDDILKDHIDVVNKIQDLKETINGISSLINSALFNGKKLLIMGNGGSAADSQHFAAEIVGRYKMERSGYPAIALTTDSSIITSIANDYSYEMVFSRQVQALADDGDVVIGLSTSGNSRNVMEGFIEAGKRRCKTVSLLGKDGGILKNYSDYALIIPSDTTARVQECHILIIHLLCDLFEKGLVENGKI